MSLDFQEVRKQVIRMGESALERESALKEKREKASRALSQHANEIDALRQRVKLVSTTYDRFIRTAVPWQESLDFSSATPISISGSTLIAADGSQILPDRNARVDFSLINVGAVLCREGSADAPKVHSRPTLLSGDALFTGSGMITEARLALMRDFSERTYLAELSLTAEPPVITFTDGPLELWMSRQPDGEDKNEFERQREKYLEVLEDLRQREVTVAGYVDKPGADLVVRMLEIAITPEEHLSGIRKIRPLRGVRDVDLFRGLLKPGDRSAIFGLQSQAADVYTDELALHFFYLNVGRDNRPSWARVEVPAWVVNNPAMLNSLHTALVQQCRVMGNRPYPYLLHRAHETAVVTYAEKDEVEQMVVMELIKRGGEVGDISNKQAAKNNLGRMRY